MSFYTAVIESQPSIPSISLSTQVSFVMQNIRVKESDRQVNIPIGRSGQGIPFTINIRTVDGSAIGKQDYVRVMGPVAFEADDVEVHIRIRIIDDDVPEPEESFTVLLFNPSLGVISLGLNVVTITIEDDDGDVFGRRDGGAPILPPPRPQPPPVSNRPGSSYSGLLSSKFFFVFF